MSGETRTRLALAAAVAISTVLVVTSFNPAPHSGGDNSGYLSLAYGLVKDGVYVDAFDPASLPHTKYPPVFPLLLAALMAMGARTWVAFKATAAVATVAAVGFTSLWAGRRLGPLPGLAVATLVAAASAVVYYSHWILSDPLFLALTLAAVWALDVATEDDASPAWLALGIVAATLAFFTRQAGLPLVVASVGWLLLRRRWRGLAATAVVVGVPALAWWWRGRTSSVASYGEEFWMLNPYDPSLGTIGVLGLVPRAFDNLGAYLFTHGPAGIVGRASPLASLLGVGLTLLALAGWGLSVRKRVGPVELFVPLYAGLILLWPTVWAGDRFALPLYPLLFVYAAMAVSEGAGRLPGLLRSLVPAALFLALLLPEGSRWMEGTREARACATIVRSNGAFDCYGERVARFAEAATWAGRALPEGAAVLSRKPRHFYLLSGLPSRTFAFSDDPAAQLELADEVGARYVLLDQWDGLAARYVGGAVRARPDAYCFVRAFGAVQTGGAQLLGIVPPDRRDAGGASAEVGACPEGYVRADAETSYASSSSSSTRVPLLAGLDS